MEIFPYWDLLMHCCLCLMSVAAWCPVVWIDHCFFICSSPVDWSRMCKFGNFQSLHVHTDRQLEFIACLCRVKDERNKLDVCVCMFTRPCSIFIPVYGFRGDGICSCMNYLYVCMYIAWTVRKLCW